MAGYQDVAQELTPPDLSLSAEERARALARDETRGLSVAVIGGGYAGMAAAVALADCGIPVTVFESALQLGGRARGVSYQDTHIDNGQHLLLGCYRQTLHMIEKVGGNIEQDFLRLPLRLDLHGKFSLKAPRLPAPLHLLAALLTARGLTWNERMNAARFVLILRRINFKLLPPRKLSPVTGEDGSGEDNDITVTELLAQHGQDAGLVQKLWEPLCIAALNTPVGKASARVFLNVLRDALNQSRAYSDMLLPRINFTALLPQRAADFVEQRGGKVRIASGVEAIIPYENGVELRLATAPAHADTSSVHHHASKGESGNSAQQFSHVICAAPPTVAARLLRPIAAVAETVAQIDNLEHQPIYTVYLQYPAHVALPHAMLGLHQRYSQWLFDRGRIAAQHGLLAAVISAEGIHQELSQEALAQKVIEELREEFGIAEQPAWYKVIAEKRATFCCSPNLRRPSQQTALPRLLLAGDYTAGDYPATLEGAVMSGLKCADVIST